LKERFLVKIFDELDHGTKVASLAFLIELPALDGRKLIEDYVVNSVVNF
jgi:adenine/guanine phosphoribosyltransferase-like PRPP-binding protein